MRILSSDLQFWAESIRVNGEKTVREEKTFQATGEGLRDDTVTISTSGHVMSDSRKQSDVVSHAVVHGLDGQATEVGYNYSSRESLARDETIDPRTTVARRVNTSLPAKTSATTLWNQQLHDEERLSFSATGSIVMADGRQVEFSQELLMQREFDLLAKGSREIAPAPVRADPLVINFSGSAPSLSNAKYTFDLHGDGEVQEISFVGPGSGFLALDKNGDGVITDGGELFGPTVGNGFKELQAYDQDHNGWIDENDALFSRLSVWHKVGPGFNRLQSLNELAIGAISLESIETKFSITNHGNEFQGEVVSSGVILKEDGSVYTIQQVDLGVKRPSPLTAKPLNAQLITAHDMEEIERIMGVQAERGDGALVAQEGSGLYASNISAPAQPRKVYSLFMENQTLVQNSALSLSSHRRTRAA